MLKTSILIQAYEIGALHHDSMDLHEYEYRERVRRNAS
jgi:hypothetical protein